MEIGKRIMELREAAGWTTNRLANLCGLSQSFLRSVELGEKGISVENLQLICDTLHISLRDFFDVPSDHDTEQDSDHQTHKRAETGIDFFLRDDSQINRGSRQYGNPR